MVRASARPFRIASIKASSASDAIMHSSWDLCIVDLSACGGDLKFLNCLTHFDCSGCGWQWSAVAHGDGAQRPFRKFPEVATALEAEDASPEAVQVDRNDRRIYALHDALKAAAKRKQLAGPRHLAFGEDADNLPVADRVAGRPHRLDQVSGTLFRRNRDGAGRPCKQSD